MPYAISSGCLDGAAGVNIGGKYMPLTTLAEYHGQDMTSMASSYYMADPMQPPPAIDYSPAMSGHNYHAMPTPAVRQPDQPMPPFSTTPSMEEISPKPAAPRSVEDVDAEVSPSDLVPRNPETGGSTLLPPPTTQWGPPANYDPTARYRQYQRQAMNVPAWPATQPNAYPASAGPVPQHPALLNQMNQRGYSVFPR